MISLEKAHFSVILRLCPGGRLIELELPRVSLRIDQDESDRFDTFVIIDSV